MPNKNDRVPAQLKAGIGAILALTGAGTGVYLSVDNAREMQRHEYVQAVAADESLALHLKIAVVMGAYYESSYKHIGTPYVDKLGKGSPLTVCNGITGPAVIPGKYYTPTDCYRLEKQIYLKNEIWLNKDIPTWGTLPIFAKATVVDFLHNKGSGAFSTSTKRKLLLSGDLYGMCKQNERWNKGTVNGVSTILPGLKVRGDANTDICLWEDPYIEPTVQAQPPIEPEVEVQQVIKKPEQKNQPWWKLLFKD